MAKLFEQVMLLSILGSVLVLAILLIKAIFKHKVSAKFHYYIWFMLLLRLLIIAVPVSPLSVSDILPKHPQPISTSSSNVQTNLNTAVPPPEIKANLAPDHEKPPNPLNTAQEAWRFSSDTAAVIWVIGSMAVLLSILSMNLRWHRKLKNYVRCDRPDVNLMLEKCRSKLKIATKVPVFLGPNHHSPALYGPFRPKILLSPNMINSLSNEELEYVFLHELAHFKRKDLFVNIVCLVIQAVYWFNPLILYAIYKMKQDCEIACDATVLDVLGKEEIKRYGHTIINIMQILAQPKWLPGTLDFAGKYNTRRITMIKQFKKASALATSLAIVLGVLAGCASISNPTAPAADNAGPAVTTNETTAQNTQTPTQTQTVEPLPTLNQTDAGTGKPTSTDKTDPTASGMSQTDIQKSLAASGKNIYDVTWSPDKTRVVFIRTENQTDNIYVWKVGQTKAALISRAEATTSGFSWSPNSKYFLVNVGHMGPGLITSTLIDSGSLKAVKAPISSVSVSPPIWSPNSEYLALSSDLSASTGTATIEMTIYSLANNETISLLKSTNIYGPYRLKYWDKNGNIGYTETNNAGNQIDKVIKSPV